MDQKGSDRVPRSTNKFFYKKKNHNQSRNGYEKGVNSSKHGAIGELPILKYGKVSNYEEFKRRLIIYAEREYGLLGTLFRTMNYYVPPQIEEGIHYVVEDFDAENDPLGLHRATLLEEMKARTKAIIEMESKRTALFAVVWGQISQESEQVIMQHDNWPLVEPHDDPLALWRVITETHVVMATGNAQVDRNTARESYARMHQDSSESLVQFKERFDHAIRALEAYGVPLPIEQDIAADFINKLDSARYTHFKVELMNNTMLTGAEYPANLTDAFNKASRYKVVVQTSRLNKEGLTT